MSKEYLETEVKIRVTHLANIEQRLQTMGAVLTRERIFERNVRYDTPKESLLERGALIRLRTDDRIRLTFKADKTAHEGITTRREIEVLIDDFNAMEEILRELGYQRIFVYEKYRTTYTMDEAEIVLDELPYGDFIEIEGEPETIERLLAELDLAIAERIEESYTRLFEYVQHHLSLPFRDLTFVNFENVEVPPEAFIPPGSIVIE